MRLAVSSLRRILEPIRQYWLELRTTARGWDAFWFAPADPTTLAAIRISVGSILLYIHLSYTPTLLDHVGPQARIDATAIETIRSLLSSVTSPADSPQAPWIGPVSWWFHVTTPTAIWTLHLVFLAAVVCLTLGLLTRAASIVAWAGHVSFLDRGHLVGPGVDAIVAMIALYLMLGPSGQALSLDRVVARVRGKGPLPPDQPRKFVTANIAVRLIQVHMCIVYLSAGLSKLQGSSWWDGTAVYLTLMTYDLRGLDVRWIATYDWLWQAISSAGTWFTIAFEVGFAVLVWHPLLRPLVLGAALLLHGGIAVSTGLWSFSAAMLAGCLAFVPPSSLRWLLDELLPRERTMERAGRV
jgi:hypothetical protein